MTAGTLIGREALVIGSGIAGLSIALALARLGARVEVLEQASGIREFGAGLQISPNGMVVLKVLGVDCEGIAAGAVELLNAGGRPVLRMDLTRADRPYRFVHRGALIEALAAAARASGVRIATGQRVEAVQPSDIGAAVTLADGGRRDTALLIGADGLHSRTRPAVGPVTAPFFTGQVAWRAVIPAEAGAPPVASVVMGPGRHLVSYPLPGEFRNIVAVEERRHWTQEGWNNPGDPNELRRVFAGLGGPVPGWLARVEKVHQWGLFRHPVATSWHRGGAVILGDAAHPTLPFLAQGANMALEDAWLLADRLAHLPQAEAFAAFQAARHPRVERIIAATQANARNYHLRGPLRVAAHLALRLGGRIAPDAAAARFEWLYGFDVTR